jgi:hypothetical protein
LDAAQTAGTARFSSCCAEFRTTSAENLRYQLPSVFSARAARLGTLHGLTKLVPVAIIADMVGYSVATIKRHAIASAASYSEYVAVVFHPRSAPAVGPVHGTLFVPVAAEPSAAVLLIGGSGGSEPSYAGQELAGEGVAAWSGNWITGITQGG